jgi:hypothetical protein
VVGNCSGGLLAEGASGTSCDGCCWAAITVMQQTTSSSQPAQSLLWINAATDPFPNRFSKDSDAVKGQFGASNPSGID